MVICPLKGRVTSGTLRLNSAENQPPSAQNFGCLFVVLKGLHALLIHLEHTAGEDQAESHRQ